MIAVMQIAHFTQTILTRKNALMNMLTSIMAIAVIFVFLVMPLPLLKSRIWGPTYLLLIMSRRNFREPLAKQKVAIKKNTNPGIIGVMYPIIPTPTKIKPNEIQNARVIWVEKGVMN